MLAISLFPLEYSSFSVYICLQALRVSDHYPVEVELQGVSPFWLTKSLKRDNVGALGTSVCRAVTGMEKPCNLLPFGFKKTWPEVCG